MTTSFKKVFHQSIASTESDFETQQQQDFEQPDQVIQQQIPSISSQIALNSITMYQGASCGYCQGRKKTSKLWVTCGFQCKLMGIQEYQMLLDRGWRRSGAYYYRPFVAKSCCQAFTIRLNTRLFVPRKSQTKVLQNIKYIKLQNTSDEFKLVKNTISTQNKKVQLPQTIVNGSFTQQNNNLKEKTYQDMKQLLGSMISRSSEISLFLQSNTCYDKIIGQKSTNQQNQIEKMVFENLVDLIDRFTIYESRSDQVFKFGCNAWAIFYSDLSKLIKEQLGVVMPTIQMNVDFRENINKIMKQQNMKQCQNELYQMDTHGQIYIHSVKIKNIVKEKKFIINKNDNTKLTSSKQIKLDQQAESIIVTKWVKAEFDQESFNLYTKYQKEVHKKDNSSKESYISFLCQNSLQNVNIQPKNGNQILQCGCWHIKYYLEGHLISVGVVDVMPYSMSSVYFFYDPQYRRYSLGVYGVLCEIEYMKEMQRNGHPQFCYYYLGFYIEDISKMKYKGDYQPSEILCPATFQWIKQEDPSKKSIVLKSSNHLLIQKTIVPSEFLNLPFRCEVSKEIQNEDYLDIIEKGQNLNETDYQIVLEDMNFQGIDESFLKAKLRLLVGKNEISITHLKPSYTSYLTNLFQRFLPLIGTILIQKFLFVFN